ncbi:MAG: replication-associated recombination protein A [Planctomycetes bacterium]|nr:replication-associated recombination protein A [Planctomycetota bacterium]
MAGLFDRADAARDADAAARRSMEDPEAAGTPAGQAPRRAGARPRPPLAERMRPRTVEEFVGQEEILGPNRPLLRLLAAGTPPSLILWGPPGSGKTTLARLLAGAGGHDFVAYSAVTSGVKEIKEVLERSRWTRERQGRRTILFIDEIHRFNRAQQDAFLPAVEDGTIVLVGATTENPSFEVNAALLSRCRVLVLRALTEAEVRRLLERALADTERGLGELAVDAAPEALEQIARLANGDARVGLTLLEVAAQSAVGTGAAGAGEQGGARVPLTPAPSPPGRGGGAADGEEAVVGASSTVEGAEGSQLRARLTVEGVRAAAQARPLLYDRAGEEHFNIISALHKSLRGGDVQASLYWLGRMLESGEDPLYVARRMVRFASEDVGLADPQALGLAIAAKDAVHFIGMPEGALALAQLAAYLAAAPKSNALYTAYARVQEDLRSREVPPVPLWIRNAVTPLMTEVGYGAGYLYPHDHAGGVVDQAYLPDSLRDRSYYRPTTSGFEATLAARMAAWAAARAELRTKRTLGSTDEAR